MTPQEAFVTRLRRHRERQRVSIDDIARRLATSPRSLQRRLRDEGVTFADLVRRTREDLARRYLKDPGLTVTEVAYLLGFSEASAFSRAFRAWTGRTPGEFRTDPAR